MTSELNTCAVELMGSGVKIRGKHEVLLCGSLFYFRLPRAVWKDRIDKIKRAGYNCVDVYFPWNYHETREGVFDFSGEKDVAYFLDALCKAGIYVIARPGPYICSEWNGGAIPARVLESGKPIREASKYFLGETEKWYNAILPVIAPYTYPRGGSVILLQLENELDFFDCPDPEAYIGALTKMAGKHINDIPQFCCAGQYEVKRAGGLTKGVEATLNCYPDSADNTFDAELCNYGRIFASRNKPLMVSETNRDHFLLRRELSCGAKLLGAYNQVAGVNFEYYQAVNNWGAPDSLLATVYDFESMVGPIGNYRPEAKEGLLFGAFLSAMGEAMGAARVDEPIKEVLCSRKTTADGLRVLSLYGGGKAVCVPNFDEKNPATVEFTAFGRAIKSEVPPLNAPFFVFDMPLGVFHIDGKITRTDCELIGASETELVFRALSDSATVGLDFGDGEIVISENCRLKNVDIKIVRGDEALAEAAKTVGAGDVPEVTEPSAHEISEIGGATPPVAREIKIKKETTFAANNVPNGEMTFSVTAKAGKELFIEHPCDMLRVDTCERGETYFADGRDVCVPPSKDGKYTVTVTKWGHSNFDDSQSPAIRAAVKKGVGGLWVIEEREKIGRCDFRLLDTFGERKLPSAQEISTRISIDKWNSTRKPVVCAYTFAVKRTTEHTVLKYSEDAEAAVYIEGKLHELPEFGTCDISGGLRKNGETSVTIVFRKRVWTQNMGTLEVLHLTVPACISKVTTLGEREVLAMTPSGENVSLPLKVESEAAVHIRLPADNEAILRLGGENLLVTAVAGGRVLGRATVKWEHGTAVNGGEPNELYVSGALGRDVCLYLQSLGRGSTLEKIETVY